METEKIVVFHRKLYQKKRKHFHIYIYFLTSGFVSNFVVFERYLPVLTLTRAIIINRRHLALSHVHHALLLNNDHVTVKSLTPLI